MMKEQLISFDTAKLAKEKGFDELCDCLWNFPRGKKLERCVNKNSELNKEKPWYSAPTQSLLQKWLREEHKIYINIVFNPELPNNNFVVRGYYDIGGIYDSINRMFEETYEEALEKGLQEALKLINP